MKYKQVDKMTANILAKKFTANWVRLLHLSIPTLLLVLLSCSNPDHRINEAENVMGENPKQAISLLAPLLDAESDMDARRAKAVMLLCKAKSLNGEAFLTVSEFDKAMDYFEAAQDTSALIEMHRLASSRMYLLGHQDSAAVHLKKVISLSSPFTSPTKAELYIELSNLYAQPSLRKDYDSAILFAKKALVLSGTKEERARSLHDIGLFYSFKNCNDSALRYMEKALAETDAADPQYTTYALNYAGSASLEKSLPYLDQIRGISLGKQLTLGFLYLNDSRLDSAQKYLNISQALYKEDPARYSVNTYNNLRLLEQAIGYRRTGVVSPSEGTVTNDSITEVTRIQNLISEERREYSNRLQLQLLESRNRRQLLLNIGLGTLLILATGFGIYVWYSKRKYLRLKRQLESVRVEQIVSDAKADEMDGDKSFDLVRRRLDICIEQFRESRLQTKLDKMAMQFRASGTYPPVKEREAAQNALIGSFADFIVDLKMTGVKLNLEDIVTCLMSCLRESNPTIAACLGSTETAVRTRKSRLRTKLPEKFVELLNI